MNPLAVNRPSGSRSVQRAGGSRAMRRACGVRPALRVPAIAAAANPRERLLHASGRGNAEGLDAYHPGRALAWFAALVVAAAFWAAFALGAAQRPGPDLVRARGPRDQAHAQLATVEVEVADVVRTRRSGRSWSSISQRRDASASGASSADSIWKPRFSGARRSDPRVVRVRLPSPRLLALDPRIEWSRKGGWMNRSLPRTAIVGCCRPRRAGPRGQGRRNRGEGRGARAGASRRLRARRSLESADRDRSAGSRNPADAFRALTRGRE